jgi:hypothetical protein
VVVAPKTISPKKKTRPVDDEDDDDKSIELTYLYEPSTPTKDTSTTCAKPTRKPIVVAVSKHHHDSRRQVLRDWKNDKSNKAQKCIYLPPSCKLLATGGSNKMAIFKSTKNFSDDAATATSAPSSPFLSSSSPSRSTETTPAKRFSAPKGLVLNAKGDLVPLPAATTTTGVTTESSNENIVGTTSASSNGSSNNPWARVKLKKTLSNNSPAAFKDIMRRAGKSEVGGALW